MHGNVYLAIHLLREMNQLFIVLASISEVLFDYLVFRHNFATDFKIYLTLYHTMKQKHFLLLAFLALIFVACSYF